MATMTFDEYLTANSDTYGTVDVDDDTKSAIYDWFQFRHVVDDEKFGVFFRRRLSISSRRYEQLLRVELTEFDPLVSTYRERQLKQSGTLGKSGTNKNSTTRTGSNTTTTKESGTDTTTGTRTPNLTTTDTPNVTETRKDTYGQTNTRTGSETDEETRNGTTSRETEADAVNVQKQAPQSIAYSSASDGEIPALDWQYMTSQAQAKNTSSETGSTDDSTDREHTYNSVKDAKGGSDTSELSRTGSNTTKQTGTEATEANVTYGKTVTVTSSPDNVDTSEGSTQDTETRDFVDQEIWTGRDGLTPQEALQKARDYIIISNAFAWLRNQLEPCFLAIYDV